MSNIVTFPLCPVLPGPSCGCGDAECTCIGKHPLIAAWNELVESVPAPEGHGHGVLCGTPSRLVVVDIDRPDAVIPGDLPETLTVRTGREPEGDAPAGGLHLYYELPEGVTVRTRHLDGWDIQGEGAFVVGVGSLHKSGRRYELEVEGPPAPAPAWLLEFAGAPSAARTPGAARGIFRSPGRVPGPEELPAIAEAIAAHPIAVQGEGGSQVTWNFLQEFLITRHLDLATIRPMLEAWNARCEPPWQPDEWERKISEVWEKSRVLEGGATPGLLDRLAAAVQGQKAAERSSRKHTYVFGRQARIEGEEKPHPVTLEWVCDELAHGGPWSNVFRRDEFFGTIRAIEPIFPLSCEGDDGLTNADVTLVRRWLEREKNWVVRQDDATRAIESAAGVAEPYHPVRAYLERLPAAPPGAIAEFSGLLSSDPIDQLAVRCWLISAVARVCRPGSQVDMSIVLAGQKGGEGKSTTLRILFGQWHRTGLPSRLDDPQKVGLALAGNWGVEMGELVAIRRSEKEELKDFFTRTVDKFRFPYERTEQAHPRQCVFAGTCNDLGFLDKFDTAFKRRFYGIEIHGAIDTARVAELRDAIWAEVYAAYLAGEKWWLTGRGVEQSALDVRQEKFEANDQLDDLLTSHMLESPLGVRSLDGLTALQIFLKVCPRENGYPTNVELKNMAGVLRGKGFTTRKTSGKTVWLAPEGAAAQAKGRAA